MEKEEWRKWRHKKIGGSDAPIIMGVSRHKTPFQLYEEMIRDEPPPEEKSFVAERGDEIEIKVRAIVSMEHGVEYETALIESEDFPWRTVSLDGMSPNRKIILEIKDTTKENHELAKKGIVPEEFKPQVQHALDVSGADLCWYISHNDPNRSKKARGEPTDPGWKDRTVSIKNLAFVKVEFDQEYAIKLLEEEMKFYDCVEKKKPPQLSDRDYKKLKAKGLTETIRKYKRAKLEMEKIESEIEAYRDRLIELAKETGHPRCMADDLKIIEVSRMGSIDYKKIPAIKQMSEEELDKFRKKGSLSWQIRM